MKIVFGLGNFGDKYAYTYHNMGFLTAECLADKLGLKVEQFPVSVINFRESKVNVVRDSARMFRDVFRIRRAVRGGKTEQRE